MRLCRDCRYYELIERQDSGGEDGWCRRRGPVVVIAPNGTIATAWPRVCGELDWCGDFVPGNPNPD